MRKRNPITIKQVAKSAGVSTQTVSRVINNRPDVAPETRQRVLEIIETLGYRPSQIARSLSQGHTRTLGVVGSGIEFYGTARILVGIEESATQLGYRLLLSLVNPPDTHNVEPILRDMLSRNVDGIIWHVPQVNNNHAWICNEVQHLETPVVFISTQPQAGISIADIDNRTGGRIATEHLIQQGYRHIGIITGPKQWYASEQRRLGWQDALLTANMEVHEKMVVNGDWTSRSGEVCMHQLFDQFPEIDAVFAFNDPMALGAMQAALNTGRRIPHDLGVVGYDDVPDSAFYSPPLTTVGQDLFRLGQIAVQELEHRIIAMRRGETNYKVKNVLLQPELVIRQSSRMFKSTERR